MGKPLFKAPDGGQFKILWEREDPTQSELQRGQKLPCFPMRWFAQKPFRPAYPCPCGQIFMQYLGLLWFKSSKVDDLFPQLILPIHPGGQRLKVHVLNNPTLFFIVIHVLRRFHSHSKGMV
jgi:hypothetical protein